MPSHLKRSLWRFNGMCCPNLSNKIVASSLGPMKPRGVAWNGAGGCVMVWQARHENFSRTVSISFHRPRHDLQRLGHVLAQLRQLGRSATRAARRRGKDNPLAFNILGERLTGRPLARERADRLRLLGRLFSRQLVLGRRCFRLLQLQLKLIEQPLLAPR
jgi:hypothetical protein